ncbi:MAG: CPBP family intramembrane metalloprotease [Clostridiales bacterium]|nr:CPBP family intramembrane metalloprotease [Clostridiales bacterium]
MTEQVVSIQLSKYKSLFLVGAVISFILGMTQGIWLRQFLPQNDFVVYVYVALQELFVIGIPAILLMLRKKDLYKPLFTKPDTWSIGLVALAAVSFSLAAILISVIWITLLQSAGINFPLPANLPKLSGPFEFSMAILLAAIIPAVSEEMMFRGLLQIFLRNRLSGRKDIFVVAFIFALLHFSVHGFAALFFIGLFLSMLVNRYKSLWLAIIFHILYNSIVIILQTLDSLPSVRLIFLCLGIYLAVSYLLFQKKGANVWI